MNDRELLELAAKAAGIAIQRSRLDDPIWRDMLLVERHKEHSGVAVGWNPLRDDGDALRLAVKLHMIIEPMRTMGGKWFEVSAYPSGRGDCQCIEALNDDPFSATRRAIVCAAAELGKNQPYLKE